MTRLKLGIFGLARSRPAAASPGLGWEDSLDAGGGGGYLSLMGWGSCHSRETVRRIWFLTECRCLGSWTCNLRRVFPHLEPVYRICQWELGAPLSCFSFFSCTKTNKDQSASQRYNIHCSHWTGVCGTGGKTKTQECVELVRAPVSHDLKHPCSFLSWPWPWPIFYCILQSHLPKWATPRGIRVQQTGYLICEADILVSVYLLCFLLYHKSV